MIDCKNCDRWLSYDCLLWEPTEIKNGIVMSTISNDGKVEYCSEYSEAYRGGLLDILTQLQSRLYEYLRGLIKTLRR